MIENLRGLVRVFQRTYRGRKTGRRKKMKTWWIELHHNGKQIRKASGSSRRSEAMNMLREHLDESTNGRLITGRGARLCLNDLAELETLIRRQRELTDILQRKQGRIIPWIFHCNGERIREFKNGWRKAVKRAGMIGKIPHDFRRTAVLNLERAGVPRSVAMKLVGHRTESIYRRDAM